MASTVRPASARTGATKVGSQPLGLELRPGQRERAGGDRAARDAGDAVEPLEPARVVQPPHDADVEQHGPVAAAREAERDAVSRLVGAHGANPKRPGSGMLDFLAQALERAAAGRADAADRHAELPAPIAS